VSASSGTVFTKGLRVPLGDLRIGQFVARRQRIDPLQFTAQERVWRQMSSRLWMSQVIEGSAGASTDPLR
jgi:hypothetical protein